MQEHNRLIIFDLDGTLYEDTHHFDYYAKKLCEKLSEPKRKLFTHDYQAVLEGKHPLKMGTIFDVEKDLILTQDHGRVTYACTWEGQPLEQETVEKFYPSTLNFDFHSILNIGDLWWIPAAIARHYGITNQDAECSFIETREYMMSPRFQMREVPDFKQVLKQLAIHSKLILLTNSPKRDSEVLLSKLGFQHLFDKKIFDGKKPMKTKEHIKMIKESYLVEYNQILSIGDNVINEISPAKELGCQTILIDSHGISAPSQADRIVQNLTELVDILKQISQS
ncbi:HAD family hydrolase [Heyndrickxia sp. FSL W8-0496]|uniref:HAD family hydrolase n=1 Tax=Heyndrickxia TaxID=2837504 RepID=UPI0030FA8ED0